MDKGGGSMSKQISLLSSPVINHLSIEDGALMAVNPFTGLPLKLVAVC